MVALLVLVIGGVVVGMSLWARSSVYMDEAGRPWREPYQDTAWELHGRRRVSYIWIGRVMMPLVLPEVEPYEERRERWRR